MEICVPIDFNPKAGDLITICDKKFEVISLDNAEVKRVGLMLWCTIRRCSE